MLATLLVLLPDLVIFFEFLCSVQHQTLVQLAQINFSLFGNSIIECLLSV